MTVTRTRRTACSSSRPDQPGFLGVESARHGLGITVCYWTDEAAIAAWKAHAEHALAQERGRTEWYRQYALRIARVERAYTVATGVGASRCRRSRRLMLPERIELPDAVLRPFRTSDADALARAVGESLEHLRPWMPWANNGSAEPDFQRRRLVAVVQQWNRGDEYQYGLFDPEEARVLGSFGLMTRRGRSSLEIGYWVHVDATGRGHATRAAAALTDVALDRARRAAGADLHGRGEPAERGDPEAARFRAGAGRGRGPHRVQRDRPPAGVAAHDADRHRTTRRHRLRRARAQ